MNEVAVSVVIASRNRPAALRRCLDALARQTGEVREGMEIVVVDDESDPPYERVPEAYAGRAEVKVVRRRHGGPGPARNSGVAVAAGSLILFTDDDCLPDPTWVETLVRTHREMPGAILGGRVANALSENVYSSASEMLAGFLYEYFNRDPSDAGFFTTNNLAVAGDVFRRIGGFDEGIPVTTSEDRELCDRLRHLGYTLVYVPDAVVGHAHPLGPFSFWAQHFGYGRGALHYRRLHVERGQGPVPIEPPTFYWNMLWRPFRGAGPGPRALARALTLAFLMAVSQVAVAAGLVVEWALFGRRTGS